MSRSEPTTSTARENEMSTGRLYASPAAGLALRRGARRP
jgi:hypothetical protein